MRLNSITTQLLILIVGAFVVTTICVLIVADYQLTNIINKSQNALYKDKIDSICNLLKRTNERLEKTGLPDAYSIDFKRNVLKELKEEYYTKPDMKIYPFIIDRNNNIILHPKHLDGMKKHKQYENSVKTLEKQHGEFTSTYKNIKKWYIYQLFEPWGWTIVYAVPVDIKYHDAIIFRNTLFITMFIISTLILACVSVIISRFMKPIINLTQASTQIADGNLGIEIDTNGNNEIAILSQSFSRMRDSIAKQINELHEEIAIRKQTENDLENVKNYTKSILNSISSVIIGVDPQGRITQWNTEAEKSTSIKSGDAIGKDIGELIPMLAHEKKSIFRAVQQQHMYSESKVTRSKEGQVLHKEISIYPLIADKTQGAVVRIDDVSERIKMEKLMIQSEKMSSIAGLTAGMAHEINNPLAIIIQGIQNIQRRLDPTLKKNIEVANKYGIDPQNMYDLLVERKVITFLNGGKKAVERASDIVKNMLMFSRKSNSVKQPTDIVKLIEHTIELGATDYDMKKKYDFKFIDIRREYESDLPMVNCCPSEIEQVLLNLFKNALQAMENIKKDGYKPLIKVCISNEQEYIRIEIEDNGPGISELVQKRIFEPFFTTKPVGIGTGLGLSVSFMIITQNHNGVFEVESEMGKYTKFTIKLPI